MKQKKIIFIAIMVVAVVVSFGYIAFKYNRYKKFIVAGRALPFELKLGEFYAEFLRLPRSNSEYIDFANQDRYYGDRLNIVGCYIKYDSLKEEIILYSPGFDGDDDDLLKTYDPYDVNFASSLLKDGDVILQTQRVVDFLLVLDDFVGLREDKPDSTLKPIQQRLFRLAACYADTVIPIKDRHGYPLPVGASSVYGETWFEFRKINGTTSLRLYSELDSSLIRPVETGLLSEVNKQGILRDVNNVAIGFSINFLGPIFCPGSPSSPPSRPSNPSLQ
jgi:hypothetical protein